MNHMKGMQSILFGESPFLTSSGSVVGKKESEGPLGKKFDIASDDDLFGEQTWEAADVCYNGLSISVLRSFFRYGCHRLTLMQRFGLTTERTAPNPAYPPLQPNSAA